MRHIRRERTPTSETEVSDAEIEKEIAKLDDSESPVSDISDLTDLSDDDAPAETGQLFVCYAESFGQWHGFHVASNWTAYMLG